MVCVKSRHLNMCRAVAKVLLGWLVLNKSLQIFRD